MPVHTTRGGIGEGEIKPTFPEWNSSRINFAKVAYFSSLENDRQRTTFHQQSTTNSPAKNHVLYTVFCQNPSKNAGYPARKKY